MPKKRPYKLFSEIKSVPVKWLLKPYIPFGKVTVVQGDPGEGKSTVALQLCATLSKAGKLPDGTQLDEPMCSVYQCSEDGVADTIKPRLEKADADCSKVAIIEDLTEGLTLDDSRIEETIRDLNAKLFIIDPLQAYLGKNGSLNNPIKMRNLIGGLAKIAEKYGCAIILICHMSKTSKKNSLYRCLGSIDIPANVRSALMVVRDKDDRQVRYIFQIKNNLGEEGRAIAFKIGEEGFSWLGKCDVSLEDVLSGKPAVMTKLSQVREIFPSLLKESDMRSSNVIDIFRDRGISKRTLKAGKKDIGAVSYRKNGRWYMSLNKDNDPKQDKDNE